MFNPVKNFNPEIINKLKKLLIQHDPEIVFFGLIFVNFGPLKIFPKNITTNIRCYTSNKKYENNKIFN